MTWAMKEQLNGNIVHDVYVLCKREESFRIAWIVVRSASLYGKSGWIVWGWKEMWRVHTVFDVIKAVKECLEKGFPVIEMPGK